MADISSLARDIQMNHYTPNANLQRMDRLALLAGAHIRRTTGDRNQ